MNSSDLIRQRTSPAPFKTEEFRDWANKFAREFGWRPSDFDRDHSNNIVNGHLLVEHGLRTTAVISFLNPAASDRALSASAILRLLGFSYNHLIDWHLFVFADEFQILFNRVKDPQSQIVYRAELGLGRGSLDDLRAERFEQIIGRRPNPNLPALDDALIQTISNWKRILSVEVDAATNRDFSALFNAVIFARALEDSIRFAPPDAGDQNPQRLSLLEEWELQQDIRFRDFLSEQCASMLPGEQVPDYLLEPESLDVFDHLDRYTVRDMLASFYYHSGSPYRYDFSIISKHALSRIYEQYVSLLKMIEPLDVNQQALFKTALPKQESNKAYGAYYTPQYLARFFARYYRKLVPSRTVFHAKIIDPASGSGIFLRSFLEQRFESVLDKSLSELTDQLVQEAFQDVSGIDIDPNAVHATSLSLALLQLAVKTAFKKELSDLPSFPASLALTEAEAINHISANIATLSQQYDVVVANPPFVRLEDQPDAMRERIRDYAGKAASGRIGSELAFLLLAIDLLKPGGFGFFVLQQSFLFSESARNIRKKLTEDTWIRCLADLSGIDVFKNRSVYTLLLVFEKKPNADAEAPLATLVRCNDFVERALQHALDGIEVEKPVFSVYEVDQRYFQGSQWQVLRKSELEIEERLSLLPRINDFMEVHQGFVSGADDIFIRDKEDVPRSERQVYAPYLPDREMTVYTTPGEVDKLVFFPFLDDEPVEEETIQQDFPETWAYLLMHRDALSGRAGVQQWWKPTRPRDPHTLLRSKIVTPHLTISPRFSLDLQGRYAISRSPLLYPRRGTRQEIGSEEDILKYFVAVLNSRICFWYIVNHSHKYGRGYTKLEIKTLRETRVPAPSDSPIIVREIISKVDERLKARLSERFELERQIDSLVSLLYGFTVDEIDSLGFEPVFQQ